MKVVQFTNWSNEDFTGVWEKSPTLIKSGQTMNLPEYLAKHFKKHLTDRELLKAGLETNHFSRADYELKCDGVEALEVKSDAQAIVKSLNEEKKDVKEVEKKEIKEEKAPWCEKCGSKGVRHKKGCPMIKKEEEEFEGLKK